jgi:hypothetical protein
MCAVNLTVDLIAWNATQGPTVSRSGLYALPPLGSKVVLSFDLKDTLAEAGAAPSDIPNYFLRLRVRGTPPCRSPQPASIPASL